MNETETTDLIDEPLASETRQPPKPPAGNAVSPAVNYGGGAGRVEWMEARIASLEAHVDHIRDDIGDIRLDLRELTKTITSAGTDVRELDDRVSSLPGKGWMFVTMLVIGAAICAVFIYLEQIRQYLGVLPPPSSVP